MHTRLTDFSKLAVHTFTNKPYSLDECISAYQEKGIPAMSVWRNLIDPDQGGIGLSEASKQIKDSGLKVPALVRGGFFPAIDAEARQKAIRDNQSYVDEAAELEADMVVLVVGAVPGMPLSEARKQVQDGIFALADYAKERQVQLAIEPLHPMYAGDKSCVNRMAEAREICEALQHSHVGIALDVYHVWWDPDLDREIVLAGEQKTLFGFHICDWRLNTRHLLTDRGLMGDGCIDIPGIRAKVEAAGFCGYNEVEVFSEEYWSWNQDEYLDLIKERYLAS